MMPAWILGVGASWCYIALDLFWKHAVVIAFGALLGLLLSKSSAAIRAKVWEFTVLSLLFLPFMGSIATTSRALQAVENGAPWFNTLGFLFASLWFVGLTFLLARFCASLWRMNRLRRHSEPLEVTAGQVVAETLSRDLRWEAPVRLLATKEVAIPMTWGGRRPIILVPADFFQWPLEQQKSVLAHEFAHVDRGDAALRILSRLTCILHWYNPLVWWASSKLYEETERACDDLALSYGTSGPDYAEHLLTIAKNAGSFQVPEGALPLVQEPLLERRIRSVLAQGQRRDPDHRLAPLAGMLGAIVLGTFAIVPTPGLNSEPVTSVDENSDNAYFMVPVDIGERKRWIKGRITDAEGIPVAGAVVTATSEGRRSRERSARSNDRGEYLLEGLRARSSHELTVVHNDFIDFEYPGLELRSHHVKGFNVSLETGIQITGQILDSSQEELKRTTVQVFGTTSEMKTSGVQTDGSFQIDGLHSGTWYLEATATETVKNTESHSGGIRTKRARATFQIEADDELPQLELVLKPGHRLALRATFDGQPIEGGTLSLGAFRSNFPVSADILVTDSQGTAEFEDVPPGQYRVRLQWPTVVGGGTYQAVSAVTLGDLDKSHEIDLPCTHLRGRVVSHSDKSPQEGVVVRLQSKKSVVWQRSPVATTRGDGRFDFGCVLLGKYWLTPLPKVGLERYAPMEAFSLNEGQEVDLEIVAFPNPPSADLLTPERNSK